MSSIQAAHAIEILATFLGGITLGVILIASRAIKREDRRRSLTGAAPDLAARGTRILVRYGSRGNRVWE
jgi:hypothetical protein